MAGWPKGASVSGSGGRVRNTEATETSETLSGFNENSVRQWYKRAVVLGLARLNPIQSGLGLSFATTILSIQPKLTPKHLELLASMRESTQLI